MHTFKTRMIIDEEGKKRFWEKTTMLPRLHLSDRQLFDLELILNGGFSPLKGFLTEQEYNSVVEKMELPDGSIWPMPIVLDVSSAEVAQDPSAAGHKIGDEIILCDKYGNPIAVLNIESIFTPDKTNESLKVFGTTDVLHPGAKYLFTETKDTYIGGSVEGIALSPKYDFKELRKSPEDLRKMFKEKGWEKVIAFQTRNPIHRAHFELIRGAAEEHNTKVLVHPVVGLTKEGDIDYITRVRAYKKLQEHHMKDFADVALLPLAMRMAGPREAVWHAIIRRNYGCTHFIVGRDHAGPGNNTSGQPFYGPYDAQNLAKSLEDKLGIHIITREEVVYVEEEGKYLATSNIKPGHSVKNISGTMFRKMLLEGEDVPSWFSFPEVIHELRQGAERAARKGVVVFFTGLSGSGKSTIANILATKLLEIQHRKVTLLDGDLVRQNLSKGLGFSREDRNTNIIRIGFVANEVARHGGIAVCSAIAPYKEARDKNRQLISKEGHYIQAYVATPFEVCQKRDVKGLYKKASAGKMTGFTGMDDPYEVPENSEIILDTVNNTAEECADQIIEYIKAKGIIL